MGYDHANLGRLRISSYDGLVGRALVLVLGAEGHREIGRFLMAEGPRSARSSIAFSLPASG